MTALLDRNEDRSAPHAVPEQADVEPGTAPGARPRLEPAPGWRERLPSWAPSTALAIGLYLAWLALDNVYHRGMPPGILLAGMVFGSLYGLLALGIVLIYRANRIINFAQADLGAVAAVLAIQFVLQLNWNYFLSIGAGLLIATAMGAGINVAVIRRFRTAPRLIATVATIGLSQILLGMSILIPLLWSGPASGNFTTPFDIRFEVFPVIFSGNHVMALILVPTTMLALAGFLRYTHYGIAIRAASENGDRASLVGIPVGRLATIVWAIAAFMSAMAVLLRVPILGFTSFGSVSGSGNILLLYVLAAAVIGRMESMPRTVIAAIGIGVFEQGASWIWPRSTLVNAMMVGVILIGLLVQRDAFNRAAETGISTWKAIKEVRPIPTELRRLAEVKYLFGALKLALVAFVVTLPLWASVSQAEAAALVAIYSIVALSLLILTGWAGQISLGQFAFVGFGSALSGTLVGVHGWDFFSALLAGTIIGALSALVVGLPALRIKGPFLAVTTLAFAVTASTFFLEERYFPWFVHKDFVSRPVLWQRLPLDAGWQIYYLAVVGLLFSLWIVRNLRSSRTGRALIAVRDNQYAAESVALNATRLKLTAFVISGAMAGFAGVLYMVSQQGSSPGAFGADASLLLFSMVVIGGLGSIPGAILGAVYVRGVEFFLPPAWELLASGMGILFLLMFIPEGLGGITYNIRDWYLRRVADRHGILVPSLVADKRIQESQERQLAAQQQANEPSGVVDEEAPPPPVEDIEVVDPAEVAASPDLFDGTAPADTPAAPVADDPRPTPTTSTGSGAPPRPRRRAPLVAKSRR